MCGIAGIYAYHYAATEVDRNELLAIREAMRSRGPDDSGEWYSHDNRVGLGHRRLSIIDPGPGGHQPMATPGSTEVITFNGEIYNFVELRQGLEARGYRFTTRSDTEVLLALYHEKGEQMVHDLRGMFAFAIWDGDFNALFLARDPYGIKPLYYSDDGWHFRFASQVNALVAGGRVSTHSDPAAEASFLLFGSVAEPLTRYSTVRALPAGSTLWVSDVGMHSPNRYCSLAEPWAAPGTGAESGGNAEDYAADRFRESVGHHLVSDVPVGTFLSAGVDSGALTGLMSEMAEQAVISCTLAFEELKGKPEDERALARDVAELYGTRHTERVVAFAEFEADLPLILAAMDQPSIDGLNTWFVSKAAAEQGVKVMISGLGGDELLGGYPSFEVVPRWAKWLKWPGRVPGLGRAGRWLGSRLPTAVGSPKAAGMLEYGGTLAGAYLLKRGLFMPWELPALMGPERAQEGLANLDPVAIIEACLVGLPPGSPHAAVSVMESGIYMRNQLLRDADWASMAHSIEVRLPLVDYPLLGQLAPLLSAGSPEHFKSWLAGSPHTPLPPSITGRAKTGFTTPVASWLEQSDVLGAWRDRPELADARCHWSRRYAYALHRMMFAT